MSVNGYQLSVLFHSNQKVRTPGSHPDEKSKTSEKTKTHAARLCAGFDLLSILFT